MRREERTNTIKFYPLISQFFIFFFYLKIFIFLYEIYHFFLTYNFYVFFLLRLPDVLNFRKEKKVYSNGLNYFLGKI